MHPILFRIWSFTAGLAFLSHLSLLYGVSGLLSPLAVKLSVSILFLLLFYRAGGRSEISQIPF